MASVTQFGSILLYLLIASSVVSVIAYTESGVNVQGFGISSNVYNNTYDLTDPTYGSAAGVLPQGKPMSGNWLKTPYGIMCDSLNFYGDADYYFDLHGQPTNGKVRNTYIINNSVNGEFGICIYAGTNTMDTMIICEFYDQYSSIYQIGKVGDIGLPRIELTDPSYYGYTTDTNPTVTTEFDTINNQIDVYWNDNRIHSITLDYSNEWDYSSAYYGGVRCHDTDIYIEAVGSSLAGSISGDLLGVSGDLFETTFSPLNFFKGVIGALSWGMTDPYLTEVFGDNLFILLAILIGVPEIMLGFIIIQMIRGN